MYFACVTTFLGLPSIALCSLELGCLAAFFDEAFVRDELPSFVVGGRPGVHHGSRLGIVLGRVQIEIQKIVGLVLSYSQIPRARTLLTTHVRLGLVHITFSILAFGFGLIVRSHLFLGVPLHFLQLIVLIHHALVFSGVVAIPAVSFRVPAQLNLLHHLIRLDIASGPLGTLLPWSAQAVLGLVCNAAAILTCTLAILCGGGAEFLTAGVPLGFGERVGLGF